jgi:16S rRNA (adenine1518-N6/adenine1519-N6)-dimethyltransferase
LVAEDRAYHVVANLPYSIASAVIRHFLEQEHSPIRMTLMVQAEVADRIVANPPDMSILAVATQFYAVPRVAFPVNPSVFFPPPTVHSSVIVLDTLPAPKLPRSKHVAFFRLVGAGFRQRRKQLANSIAAEIEQPKAEVSEWLSASGVDPTRRAETLSVDEWVSLTQAAPPGWLT